MSYEQRVRDLAVAAIGRKMRIRFAPSTSVVGVIRDCKCVGWEKRGEKLHAKYRVVVMSGKQAAYPHVYHVFQLPHPRSSQRTVPEVRACEFQVPSET